jgi:hypothetical protein
VSKVDSNLSPKDLVQLVDVSAASKYGADLTQFTRVIAEDMHNTLESFKHDMNSSLPRQVRGVVQQLQGKLKENGWKDHQALLTPGGTSS